MKRLFLLLALCLTLSACSAPAETPDTAAGPRERLEAPGLTAEEAREVLAQALLEQNPGFLAYDPETGFDLRYGPDADNGLEDIANPMAGRLLMSYGVGKDGEGFGSTGRTWASGKL